MKVKNILIASVVASLIFMGGNSLKAKVEINGYSGESIQYLIKPVGRSEYKNLGLVDLKGVKADLVTLKSKILFVEVMENIYYDPESLLPYRTERTNSGLWFNEYRTEEYDQDKFTVVIRKFKDKKLVKEQVIKAGGPIQNMNTLLFYLRKQPELKIGWHYGAKVVGELKLLKFDLKLISIDEIVVPGGKFQAYHFISVPDTFEIWIDKSSPRIPLKIIIKGIVKCSLLMKGSSLHNN